MLKQLVRPLAVKYRRFMQAEIMDYLRFELAVIRAECRGAASGQAPADLAALTKSIDAALLTLALTGGAYTPHDDTPPQHQDIVHRTTQVRPG